MVEITYVKQITHWMTPSELRDKLTKSYGKGVRLEIVANLSQQSQTALLKYLEENPDAIITTSARLSRPIESRAKVVGHTEPKIDPLFLGLDMFDKRAAIAASTMRFW